MLMMLRKGKIGEILRGEERDVLPTSKFIKGSPSSNKLPPYIYNRADTIIIVT